MTERYRVLVVDDDPDIREMLDSTLTFAGYRVVTAPDGAQAVSAVERAVPDVLIVDVMMPTLDGHELVRFLRDRGAVVPILFLSARATVEDRVRGLRVGGDDYLTKPFSVVEVTARIEALLRRSERQLLATSTNDAPAPAPASVLEDRVVGHGVELDRSRHVVRCGETAVDLSPTEFRLLDLLMTNAGFVLGKSQILDQIWGYDFGGDTNVVERFVSNLRQKLAAGGVEDAITTVRGFGYRFAAAS